MTYRDPAISKLVQGFRIKHLGHQTGVPLLPEDVTVTHRQTGAFLPPVLQGEQTVIGTLRQRCRPRGIYPQHAAFLMQQFSV